MNFVTPEFAAFFLLVLTVLTLLRGLPRGQQAALLIFNLVFYGFAGPAFLPLLLAVACINWGAVRLLAGLNAPAARRTVVGLAVLLNLSLLAFFKYYEFFFTSLESLAAGILPGDFLLAMNDLVFPVGISFYTFQGIAYTVDRFRQPGRPPESLFRVLLFVSFFPTVMAGPIMRADEFLPQLDAPEADPHALEEGFSLILSGLFKKVVLASYLSEQVVRGVFQTPEAYSSWAVLVGVYGYSLQIFCDFSGYTDLARGVARLMGYRLPENFNAPYLAMNLQDFWRRWHMSLSRWLRDYLYISLGGNRRGNRSVNLLLTMALGGLWHGAHVRFLVWGILHGLGLAVVHGFHQIKPRLLAGFSPATLRLLTPLGSLLAWLLTFHFVTLLWIFFRADDMDRALEILHRLFVFGQPGEGFALLALVAILAGFAVQIGGKALFRAFTTFQIWLPWPAQAVVLAFLTGMILKLGPDGVLPFIYFQF